MTEVTVFELSLQISDDMTIWSDGLSDREAEEVLAPLKLKPSDVHLTMTNRMRR